MNTSPNRSRRNALLIFGVILILGLFWIISLRDKTDRAVSALPTNSSNLAPQILLISRLASVAHGTNKDKVVAPSAALSSEANQGDGPEPTPLGPALFDAPLLSGAGFTGIGVVDLERLFAALQGKGDSNDARATMLQEIKRVVALRARAHAFALVVDVSAATRRDTPFVIATNGVPDITDEVLQGIAP